MSSRGGYRRRDRSWEKDDRDRDRYSGRSGRSYRDEKRRSSRSRSPRRDKDRDHKGSFCSTLNGFLTICWLVRTPRQRLRLQTRRRQEKRQRQRQRGSPEGWQRCTQRRQVYGSEGSNRFKSRARSFSSSRFVPVVQRSTDVNVLCLQAEQSKGTAHPSVDPNTPEYAEDGEAMDDANDEEMALMASMGLCGFGTTKAFPPSFLLILIV